MHNFKPKPRHRFVTALCLFVLLPLVAEAQVVTFVDLSPSGSFRSEAFATTGIQQVGIVDNHAAIWSGVASSFLDLNPGGVYSESYLYATAGGQQVGYALNDAGTFNAGVWSGTAGSFVNLHPPWASYSYGLAIAGTQQAGIVAIDNAHHAAIWSGTAASFVDLNPAGADESEIYSTAGTQQSGSAIFNGVFHAGIWSGTAGSFMDLHPAGASSSLAYSTVGSQQAGRAIFGAGVNANSHAVVWSGTPESFVDLHPSGALRSWAIATTGNQQAGRAIIGDVVHAGIWFGTAESFVDLHTSLGDDYRSSRAEGIWTDGSTILVIGSGYYQPDFATHALLWTITVPEPTSASLVLVSLAGLGILRRRVATVPRNSISFSELANISKTNTGKTPN